MEDNALRGSMNNYKGVMLCNRPNIAQEKPIISRPFCSRVDPKVGLGLNPIKKEEEEEIARPRKQNLVLKRHKNWLEVFKLKMKYKKEMQEEDDKEKVDRAQKIKEQAAKDRERTKKMREEFDTLNKVIMDELEDKDTKPKLVKLTDQNLRNLESQQNGRSQQDEVKEPKLNLDDSIEMEIQKEQAQKDKQDKKKKAKKAKPEWAMTQQEREDKEEEEVENLLNFVDNLDYDKYVDDLEVKTMIKAIQDRVDELKKDNDWKQNAKQRLKAKKKAEFQKDNNNDIQSQVSHGETRSVASERTQQSIQSIKQQMKDKKVGNNQNWDKSTTVGDVKQIPFEEKIAKLVADEIIRNHRNFAGIHSNQSLRKLLEKEAGKHLQPTKMEVAQRYDGPNITIIKERTLRKNQVDPNTLPYMHRNPAI